MRHIYIRKKKIEGQKFEGGICPLSLWWIRQYIYIYIYIYILNRQLLSYKYTKYFIII